MKTPILTAEERPCLERCGSYEQYEHMRQQFEQGICPFCTIDEMINNVLWKSGRWRLWQNAFPNDRRCSVMLTIAHTQHVRTLGELSVVDWIELGTALEFANKLYNLKGGMLFMRFGDMRLNAGIIPHLHWNLWVPDGTGEVSVPVMKHPEMCTKNKSRAPEFSKRYTARHLPE